MEEYIIRETDDFYPLSVLFKENGIGVEISTAAPEKIVKMWRMDDPITGELMASSTLEIRDDVYTLGNIAVREDLHGKGYGKIMQDIVLDHARSLGVGEVWACAKEPDFYKNLGWEALDWDTAPAIDTHCVACGKRGTICNPEKMRYTL